mgnify:CR=1 FL=1
MSSAKQKPILSDAMHRPIRYLRLSVTDRCNLRCTYCQSPAQVRYIPHEDILQYEEMLRCVRILHAYGIQKVRLTGGEPFARKGCADFLLRLRESFPDLDLRLTSNGTLLEEYFPLFKKIHVDAVNISLDSFDEDVYEKITGQHLLKTVLKAIDSLVCLGITVKINAVALNGITKNSLDDFIYMANHYGIDVRFIEFMPMGLETNWSKDLYFPVSEIIALAHEKAKLIPEDQNTLSPTRGPARMFSIKGGSGRLGFISPLSNHFCHTCNRLRLTSEGALRLCLYDDHEYPLRHLLRDDQYSEEDIAKKIHEVCQNKPLGVQLLEARKQGKPVATKVMSGIGG